MSATKHSPRRVDEPASKTQLDVRSRMPLRFRVVTRAARRRWSARSELVVGLAVVGILIVVGLLAPVIAPYSPTKLDVNNILAAPGSAGHLLGTDQLGRDLLSRLLYATRNDLLISIAAIIAPFVIGTAVGALVGYLGGWVDSLLVGIVNVIIAFPVLVLLIALVFVLGPGVGTILISVAAVNWVVYARLARGSARREAAMDYVVAARVGGIGRSRIILRHIVPNMIAQSVVYAMSDVVLVVLFLTALGYLGLGLPPPASDWGTMISDGQSYLSSQWWLTFVPGIMIMVAALGLSLIADGLAEKLDAR